jgi:hypothetical protein
MPSNADFLLACQWVGILTLLCSALAGLGFLLKWGIRFRLVGITGFMGVLTGGLFALGLVPFTRTLVPGSIHYSLVFDNGANQIVIAVPASITETELEATLRQAAGNLLFGYGRLSRRGELPTVNARTLLHPEPGVSQPVYLGQAQRLGIEAEEPLQISIFSEQLAALSKATPAVQPQT